MTCSFLVWRHNVVHLEFNLNGRILDVLFLQSRKIEKALEGVGIAVDISNKFLNSDDCSTHCCNDSKQDNEGQGSPFPEGRVTDLPIEQARQDETREAH